MTLGVPGGENPAVPDPFSVTGPGAGPEWIGRLRAVGRAAAAELPFPQRTDEQWRHTDTGRIPFEDLVVGATAPRDEDVIALASAAGRRCALVAAWDGGARVIEAGPDDVGVEPLDSLAATDPMAPAVGTIVGAGSDLFCALNAAHFSGGVAVRVAAEARPEGAIVVVHWCAPASAASFPRTFVSVGRLAEVTIVEIWAGPADAAGSLTASVVEIDVADGARLDHVALQELADSATFVATQSAHLGRDARISTTAAALGGRTHRMRTATELRGDGSSADALGVYVADGERHVDFRATQHHEGRDCTSDLLYRGAAWGRAGAVFSGLIRIEAGASGSDAHQASHFLLLSDEAHAANIPNLEILDHDVKCGHASSGGPPDEDQLYYLAARGIPPARAEHLVVDGFFADVAGRIPVPGVGDHVVAEVGRRLALLRGEP